jgi:lysophospholipase L1-like esterase
MTNKWLISMLILSSILGASAYGMRHRLSLAADVVLGKDVQPFRGNMRVFLSRHWQQADAGVTILLGDSHIQSLHHKTSEPDIINLGIGGETVAGLSQRLNDYPDMQRAKMIILSIGANDAFAKRSTAAFEADFETLLLRLPPSVPLRLTEIPPVAKGFASFNDNMQRIAALNHVIKVKCAVRPCNFVLFPEELKNSDGSLKAMADSGDHVHLSAAANQIWLKVLLK